MPNGSSSIVQKLWNYCNVLRDDGMSYGDYVEQLTYLLFLKMADERSKPPYNQPNQIPAKYDWQSLLKKDGDELFDPWQLTVKGTGYFIRLHSGGHSEKSNSHLLREIS